MLNKQVKKDSGSKKADSAWHVATLESHSRMDDQGNERQLRSMRRHHNYPRKSTRRAHAISGPRSSPSVSHVRRKRRRLEANILQGELSKIKPLTFNGEHMKGEKDEA